MPQLALSPVPPQTVQATYYVSPNGTGSACALAQPCALATARADVEDAASHMTGDLVIELTGGTYNLASTLTLTAADSGTGGHKVVFEAAPGQTAVLSGGLAITGWSLHDGTLNIWEASVPAGFSTRQIYVNGLVAQLAEQDAFVLGTITQTASGYIVSSSALGGWSRPNDVDFVYPAGGVTIAPQSAFTDSLCAVASVTGTSITMQPACFKIATNQADGPGVNIPTYIENNYALLVQPGQFYVTLELAPSITFLARVKRCRRQASLRRIYRHCWR